MVCGLGFKVRLGVICMVCGLGFKVCLGGKPPAEYLCSSSEGVGFT